MRETSICGPFDSLADVVDDDADAFALGERFDARLLRFGHDGFDAVAEIDDDLAAFEAFDEAVDQLADATDVLLVNVVALGLADFLKDDLLGGLRGDASEVFHRARQFEHVADLRAFADLHRWPLRRSSRCAGSATSSTTVLTAYSSIAPVSWLYRACRSSPDLKCLREAVTTASSIALMMTCGVDLLLFA